jgi:hypothetical protein
LPRGVPDRNPQEPRGKPRGIHHPAKSGISRHRSTGKPISGFPQSRIFHPGAAYFYARPTSESETCRPDMRKRLATFLWGTLFSISCAMLSGSIKADTTQSLSLDGTNTEIETIIGPNRVSFPEAPLVLSGGNPRNCRKAVPASRADGAVLAAVPEAGSLQNPAWSPEGGALLVTLFREG